MKESAFEKKCIKQLKELPQSYWPPKGEPGSSRGVPDRIGCIRGRFIGLEFKKSLREALKTSPRHKLQRFTCDEIQEAGGYSAFVFPENWELVYAVLKGIAHG